MKRLFNVLKSPLALVTKFLFGRIKDKKRGPFSLRSKFIFYTISISVLPLAIAGNNMIIIMEDELKSSAQEELNFNLQRITRNIGEAYKKSWINALETIRDTIDNPDMSIEEKIASLTIGTQNQENTISLQISIDKITQPLIVVKNDFTAQLKSLDIEPFNVLNESQEEISEYYGKGNELEFVHDIEYLSELDTWVLTVVLPLKEKLSGQNAVIVGKLSLKSISEYLESSEIKNVGEVRIIEKSGRSIVTTKSNHEFLNEQQIVKKSIEDLIKFKSSPVTDIVIGEFIRPDGEKIIGAYSFIIPLSWVVTLGKAEKDAYAAVQKMRDSLLIWFFIGVAISVVGAVIFAFKITRPISLLNDVASQVQKGNLSIRVRDVSSKDEIGELADSMNSMIKGLVERFQFEKFVSKETVSAIKVSNEGVQLGGERQNLTVLFSDIRGFTAFSETVPPETVVEMLNLYLKEQAILVKEFGGDIDKFVGDELIAVFRGEEMVDRAIRCSLAIQNRIVDLNQEQNKYSLWVGVGINSGEVISGAMGSQDRMDYTILGDTVNTGARLCSHAKARQILISKHALELSGLSLKVNELPGLQAKGKRNLLEVCEIVEIVDKQSST